MGRIVTLNDLKQRGMKSQSVAIQASIIPRTPAMEKTCPCEFRAQTPHWPPDRSVKSISSKLHTKSSITLFTLRVCFQWCNAAEEFHEGIRLEPGV